MATSDNNQDIEILAFAGSLRKGSYNKATVRAAKELAPESLNIQIFDLEGIPLFNADMVAIGLLGLTSGTAPSPWSLALLGLPLLRPAIIKVVELSREEELKLLFALMLAIGGGTLFEELGLSSEL